MAKTNKRTRKSEPVEPPSEFFASPSHATTTSQFPQRPSPSILSTEINLFDPETNTFRSPTDEEQDALLTQLRESFPTVMAITTVAPFIFIEANPVPDANSVPFLVAGMVAKFMREGGPYPLGASFVGEPGRLLQTNFPPEVPADVRRFHVPCEATFEALFEHIDVAEHITSLPHQLLVETIPMPDEEFQKVIHKLPLRIGALGVGYVNGINWFDSHGRKRDTSSRILDDAYDDTNYLLPENGGCLRPGVVIECIGDVKKGVDGMLTNSGVAVKKDGSRRFTASKHGWDKVDNKDVYHSGRRIGDLKETLGDDIGLVESEERFLMNSSTSTRKPKNFCQLRTLSTGTSLS